METVYAINEASDKIKEWKKAGFSIGFVPTMGSLHEGHQSLIERAAAENDKAIVSIFVNPAQFAPMEDFNSYPRNFKADLNLCEKSGVDLIFYPDAAEMYPEGFCSFVDMSGVTQELCGKSRPAHFRGVCTVVNKLFNIIKPDHAYFGQKDAQQLAIIKRMVKDLNIDVEIISCPIIREADGLAKSSRNVYLSPEERKAALILSKAILESEKLVKNGEKNVEKILKFIKDMIKTESLINIDYVEAVDGFTIEKINELKGNVLIAAAVYVGKTRLIDNFIYEVE